MATMFVRGLKYLHSIGIIREKIFNSPFLTYHLASKADTCRKASLVSVNLNRMIKSCTTGVIGRLIFQFFFKYFKANKAKTCKEAFSDSLDSSMIKS